MATEYFNIKQEQIPPWGGTYQVVRTEEFEAGKGVIAGVERNQTKGLRNVDLCKGGGGGVWSL